MHAGLKTKNGTASGERDAERYVNREVHWDGDKRGYRVSVPWGKPPAADA